MYVLIEKFVEFIHNYPSPLLIWSIVMDSENINFLQTFTYKNVKYSESFVNKIIITDDC